jgi:hypothetical protein
MDGLREVRGEPEQEEVGVLPRAAEARELRRPPSSSSTSPPASSWVWLRTAAVQGSWGWRLSDDGEGAAEASVKLERTPLASSWASLRTAALQGRDAGASARVSHARADREDK